MATEDRVLIPTHCAKFSGVNKFAGLGVYKFGRGGNEELGVNKFEVLKNCTTKPQNLLTYHSFINVAWWVSPNQTTQIHKTSEACLEAY